MRLASVCPQCDSSLRLNPNDSLTWACPCGASGVLPVLNTATPLSHCGFCSCGDLYRQKDFPQWLGMSLLTVACLLFFVFAIFYQYAIAWTILLGSAAIDGLIYLWVGDVAICYRCLAQHRGVPARSVDPFDLATAERYRQERLRREELQQGETR